MMDALTQRAQGHLWTVWPYLRNTVFDSKAALDVRPWRTQLVDPVVGTVSLSGELHRDDSATVLVVIHGLGGSIDSHYMRRAATAAAQQGLSVLLLNLRGADLGGADIYNAGLVEDLHAAITTLRSYQRILLFGYSLGGHVALRYAALDPDPRLCAVAAVCSPLDLELSARAIDHPSRYLYRRHILSGLKAIHAPAYQRFGRGASPRRARFVNTIRGWDDAIVAPRFGFQNAADYYAQMSVAPILERVRCRALYVGAVHDPVVPQHTVRPLLEGTNIEAQWHQIGGHVGFPPSLDLGQPAPQGLEPQVVSWLCLRND